MAYPILCSFLGRHEEALLHASKAVELEPLDLMTNFRVLQANYYSRRYEEAVRCGRIAIELTPDSPYTYFYLAMSLAAIDLKDEAWTIANTGKKAQRWAAAWRGLFWLPCRSAGTLSRGSKPSRGLGSPSRKGLQPRLAHCVDLSRLG